MQETGSEKRSVDADGVTRDRTCDLEKSLDGHAARNWLTGDGDGLNAPGTTDHRKKALPATDTKHRDFG